MRSPVTTPRWHASPAPLGWSLPFPSTNSMSGSRSWHGPGGGGALKTNEQAGRHHRVGRIVRSDEEGTRRYCATGTSQRSKPGDARTKGRRHRSRSDVRDGSLFFVFVVWRFRARQRVTCPQRQRAMGLNLFSVLRMIAPGRSRLSCPTNRARWSTCSASRGDGIVQELVNADFEMFVQLDTRAGRMMSLKLGRPRYSLCGSRRRFPTSKGAHADLLCTSRDSVYQRQQNLQPPHTNSNSSSPFLPPHPPC